MATKKSILSNFKNKAEEIVGRIKYAEELYKKEEKYDINDFYGYAKLKQDQIFAVINFIEGNYKLSEEERKELLTYYWNIHDIIKNVIKHAESKGWKYNIKSTWNIFSKTA